MKSKNIVLAFTLIVAVWVTVAAPHTQAQGDFLPGYDQRFNFTVESDRVTADTNITIRIRLSAAAGIGLIDVSAIFDEIAGSYKKIAITNGSGTDEFIVEVSRWDTIYEEGELWFRAPLDSATDTEFYLYYDGDAANNTNIRDSGGDLSTVWPVATDESWLRVFHLSENAGDFIDSSGNFNITDLAVAARQQEGRNGSYAVDFDDITPDYLNLGDMNLENYDNVTFITMINADDTSHGSAGILGCPPTADQFLFYVPAGTTTWRAVAKDGGFRQVQTIKMDPDEWANVFLRYSIDHAQGWEMFYADDNQAFALEASALTGVGGLIAPNPADTVVGAGALVGGNDNIQDDFPYDGLIDEVYIAATNLTAAKLGVLSYGFWDDLINWGAAEAAPPAAADNVTITLRFITALGVGIENVAVTMENATHTLFSLLTNSTGYIQPTNITAQNIILSALHDDYSDYIHLYEVNESISWVIRLGTGDEELPGIVLFIFAGLSLITFIGMIIAQSLVVSVSAAVLSFVCWSVTALYYLYENAAFPGPGVLFMLFAAISLIYAVYAGLQLINPYRREELDDIQ